MGEVPGETFCFFCEFRAYGCWRVEERIEGIKSISYLLHLTIPVMCGLKQTSLFLVRSLWVQPDGSSPLLYITGALAQCSGLSAGSHHPREA